ncbi:Uncharacterized protein Adt_20362 [Abeliophyllum distichum]|uniref:Myb/SANT-like domain-containing protein n=1 Tax=Abeliophyllum distichum TaxID=126358 RepID=A0ABD1SWC5_9LAMI
MKNPIKSIVVKPASPTRKNSKWANREHQIVLTTCETVIAKGHRSGKCFSKHVWERLVHLFNTSAANSQLKNQWDLMRKRQSTPNLEIGMFVKPGCNSLFFGKSFDLDKYAMIPTKLTHWGFDGFINIGSESLHESLPINVETRDSSDEGPVELRSNSRMGIFGCHNSDKWKRFGA